MATDTRSKFEEFVSTCSDLLKGENAQFVALIKRRYENCTESFRGSPEMATLLETTRSKVLVDQRRIFVHIKDFVTELKAWTAGSGTQPTQKRKAANPLETVAKMFRTEDSMSDGSDMEGKLQRAVLDSAPASSSSRVYPKTTSPSAHSSLSASESFAECSVLPSISSPLVTRANRSALHAALKESAATGDHGTSNSGTNVCRGEASPTSSQAAKGSGNSVQGDKISSVQSPTVLDDCSSSMPDFSGKTTQKKSIEKINGSCESFSQNGAVFDVDIATPEKDRLKLQKKSGAAEPQTGDSKLRISPGQLKFPENTTYASGTSCSDRTRSTVTQSVSSKSSALIKTVDRLKSRLVSSPSPLPSTSACNSPPLFDMTCDGEDDAEDDSDRDVIMIEDSDDELPSLKQNHERIMIKAANSSAACTETKLFVPSEASEERPDPVPLQGSAAEDFHKVCSGNEKEKVSKEKRHVKRLEKLLEKIRDKIEEVREKDLSLDELENEDSLYIFEDRLQKKFIKVWNKLCLLKGRSTSSGRPIERRFKYEGTRFPEINRKIEKFVNRRDSFPDFHDILGIIKKANTRHKLLLSVNQINDISREAFLDVGEALQERRHQDFVSTFPSRQTMSYSADQDPALFDEELQRKLAENQRIGKSRLEEVINKYSHLQTEMGEEERQDSEGSDAENLSKSASEEEDRGKIKPGPSKIKSRPKVKAEDASDSLPASDSEADEKGKGRSSSKLRVKELTETEVAEEWDDASPEDDEDGAGMIELDVAEDSPLLETYLPGNASDAEDFSTIAEDSHVNETHLPGDAAGTEEPSAMAKDSQLVETQLPGNAGGGEEPSLTAEDSHLIETSLPGDEAGTEELSAMAKDSQRMETQLPGNAGGGEESSAMAEDSQPLETHFAGTAGVAEGPPSARGDSHLLETHLPADAVGTEKSPTMTEASHTGEANHHGNADVAAEPSTSTALPGVDNETSLKNSAEPTFEEPLDDNCGKELGVATPCRAEEGETGQDLKNTGPKTLKYAVAGVNSSGSLDRTIDRLKHRNTGDGAGTLLKVSSDSQGQGHSRDSVPNLTLAQNADPTNLSEDLQSLRNLGTGVRSLLRKSKSPVKISTSLKLPRCLLWRNGGHPFPKTKTLFYPGKMQSCTSADEIDDSVTVVDSSDEETDFKPLVKEEPFVKKEPTSEHFDNGGDVIVLSDSD